MCPSHHQPHQLHHSCSPSCCNCSSPHHPPHAQNLQFRLKSHHNIYSSVSRAIFDHWHNVLDAQMVTINSAPLSGEACIAHTNRQRDEAEARRRVVLKSYDKLSKYLATIKSHAADAHAGFQHVLRDAGGHLILIPISNRIQHDHSPYSANPSITVEPPPRPYHRSHHHYTSPSLYFLNALPH
jgi:hypothetical protein